MPCTTILVGRNASNDGSTMIARTDDGYFDVKKLVTVDPKKQPRTYKSVIGHLTVELPENPMRYTTCPNVNRSEGIWAATGINEANVGMTATETITTNPRVLGADPMVEYRKAKSRREKNIPGGIGEEDLVVLVLPYIHSAREGVVRLGKLLEQYGTYESNGIAFNDDKEVWWMETIGGHHWIARRVADDECVIMPNQFGLDRFDFADAFGEGRENLCSGDLKTFIAENHLDTGNDGVFNPRNCFGSHTDSDHVYNTPRAWFMGKMLCPTRYRWEGEHADFTPTSDNIPWSFVPERKVTVEDVKYILSSYYQGTPYNPYAKAEDPRKGIYRPIGINRTGVMAICQIRNGVPEKAKGIEWICFGSTSFNTVLPVYTQVSRLPKYLTDVTEDVSTDNFYWNSRLINALTDAHYGTAIVHVERYQAAVVSKARALLREYDGRLAETEDDTLLEQANEALCTMAKQETTKTLNKVLLAASQGMKNGYSRGDN